MRERLIKIFTRFAGIDGISGQELPVREAIEAYLNERGLACHDGDSASAIDTACPDLVCPVNGGGDKMLIAHMDTIAPTAELEIQQQDDRLVSAGETILGADNRAGVAMLLAALDEALEQGSDEGFTLAFTVREETDSAGAAALQVPEGIEMGIVFDSSLRPGQAVVRGYGARRFEAVVKGRSAHAGLVPEKGVNALVAASRAVAAIEWGRLGPEATRNLGSLKGGEKTNVVPDRAVLVGEARALDVQRLEEMIAEFRESLDKSCEQMGAELDFDDSWMFHPFEHGPGDRVYETALAAIADAGLEPAATTTGGGSDANTLNARGLPSVNLGIGAQQPHSTSEFILLEDLEATYRIARALMLPRS